FSPEERWAWARDHDVEPPAYAEKPSAGGWRPTRLRDRAEGKAGSPAACPNCSKGPTHACSDAAPRKSCCKNKSNPTASDRPAGTKPVSFPGRVLTPLQCQGASTLWVSAGTVLPPPPAVTWSPFPAFCAWVPGHDDSASLLASPLLDPPPRPSAA